MARSDTIERTSVVTYGVLQELDKLLSRSSSTDDISLGLIMGLAMYMDEKIGPMRSERLFQQAPSIVLKTDAHVGPQQINRCLELIKAFGEHLAEVQKIPESKRAGEVI